MLITLAATPAHDWMDYADLVAGLTGVVVAVVALLVAVRSASDARASADAAKDSAAASRDVARFAEEQLELARLEVEAARAERARQPKLRLSLAAERDPSDDNAAVVILAVTIHNDGTRPAAGAELRVGIGDVTATIDSVRTSWGADPTPLPEHEGFAVLGDDGPFGDWLYVRETHDVAAGAAVPRYFRIHGQPGVWPFAVRLFHAESPGDGAQTRGKLNLDWTTTQPALIESPPQS